jgi:pimeloyl-ACP methyl ester carboxylesterase
MSYKPTFILVPGAWHSPEIWNKIVPALETKQYKCVRVALPSTMSNPAATFADDVNAVRRSIMAETTQGRDVVVVMHSYSGAVGSSAIKDLTRSKQEVSAPAKDPSGHVLGIAMIATGFFPTGVSFIDNFGGEWPPAWKIDPEGGFAVITVDARELFYHDLPVEEGDDMVTKLQSQAVKAMIEGGEHAYAGWLDVPVWFLATTEDKAFPVQAQLGFLQAAKDSGADITLRELESSHSPMLSKPKETTDFLLEAVSAFV